MSIGLNRDTIDKFYTKPHIMELCINEIKKYNFISSDDLIIEPSCGSGAFISGIKSLTNNYLFIDIEPENSEIQKLNFLNFEIKEYDFLDLTKFKNNPIHIIGNPPFGRQSSLANKFIKKSSEFCNSISFILPKSFKKESMRKFFPLNFHLISEIDLPDDSFLVNEISYNVPCVFQIWIKKDYNRTSIEKLEPEGFVFVKQSESPHISFRRVGVNAGLISREIETKSPQSHYFIKFINDKSDEENIESLKSVSFDFNNTVGPKSISKQELIFEFNKYL